MFQYVPEMVYGSSSVMVLYYAMGLSEPLHDHMS